MKFHVGLMAGGRGTRLWPLSRLPHLKQSLKIFHGESLLDKTISRYQLASSISLICTKKIKASLEKKGKLKIKYLFEPRAANTAPAVSFFIYSLLEKKVSKNDLVILSGTDYYIQSEKKFQTTFKKALSFAKKTDGIVLLGVDPKGVPSTEYGYLIKEHNTEFSKLLKFQEKPNLETAKNLISRGAIWNSGMFLGRLECFIEAIKHCEPSLVPINKNPVSLYKKCKEQNFDVAVLEKWTKVYATSLDCGWDDVGSWERIDQFADKHSFEGNATSIKLYNLTDKKVVVNTDKDITIVIDNDMVFISDTNRCGMSKQLLEKLEAENKFFLS